MHKFFFFLFVTLQLTSSTFEGNTTIHVDGENYHWFREQHQVSLCKAKKILSMYFGMRERNCQLHEDVEVVSNVQPRVVIKIYVCNILHWYNATGMEQKGMEWTTFSSYLIIFTTTSSVFMLCRLLVNCGD